MRHFRPTVESDAPASGVSPEASMATFFLLVFALSVPFWSLAQISGTRLLPGAPISALMVFCPAAAALLLVARRRGRRHAVSLLRRIVDYERIRAKVWYVPIMLLMPALTLASYGLMRLMRLPVPAPEISALSALLLFPVFLVSATAEELGWSGYAIDPMQERWGALRASLLLGAIWAVWHVVPLLQVGRSATWIAWWSLFTVAARVLYTWLYNNVGKSVFGVALFHATSNMSWQLFPNYGSHWDPRIAGLLVTVTAIIVTIVWGPQTLARYGQR